ncbi:tail fiber assembly protein [Salmonella enterica]|uniref:Tail fiber assembly protein n=1 Tax=Salmonella enterica subsp. enterica serovar Javiana TaxID=363569 RepID=A0A736GXZ5_SALET|nr:tail fiber assembly protein [Salmonella enterica]EBU7304247.1 tail fiber assembly protein [Salmonella enterica subsp. enterica serovar Javiana]EBW9331395.1 tail fiber assembly protein [Salmonella enterica subsp. enterica serovar Arechavaleta]EBX2616791.1 tail fiber assembly protein [Salmonella enterica subsp. enterica serovar Sandiego]ECA6278931.1 tail fiber assembly protein [Salmonella enterica subsp. enterica serovar Kiambu]ECE0522832.1 tail fiber assembly protein [Salmonella enterica sub
MRHFKKFTKTTELTPVQQELSENCSVQFIHDESGVDWYVLQKLFQPDTLKIQYDKTGLVIAADKDATKLFPLNCSVVELADTDIPDGFQAGNFTYSNGVIAPVQVDYVALATAERDRRMESVTVKINQLVEAQDDDDITADELSELTALREYRTKLRRLDLRYAPDVEWPPLPE